MLLNISKFLEILLQLGHFDICTNLPPKKFLIKNRSLGISLIKSSILSHK